MRLFWRQAQKGQRLILSTDDGEHEEEVGGVRETKRGFDAFARAFGYDPGRAQKGMSSLDEAKEFVESFRPWEEFRGAEGLSVEEEVEAAKE